MGKTLVKYFWTLRFTPYDWSIFVKQNVYPAVFTLILLQDCGCAAWVPPSSPPSSPTLTPPTSTSTPWTTTARPQTMSQAGTKSSRRALLKDFPCAPPTARSSWLGDRFSLRRVPYYTYDSALQLLSSAVICAAITLFLHPIPIRGQKLVYVNNLLICYVYLWLYLFFCVGCSKIRIAQHARQKAKATKA